MTFRNMIINSPTYTSPYFPVCLSTEHCELKGNSTNFKHLSVFTVLGEYYCIREKKLHKAFCGCS